MMLAKVVLTRRLARGTPFSTFGIDMAFSNAGDAMGAETISLLLSLKATTVLVKSSGTDNQRHRPRKVASAGVCTASEDS